MPKRASISRGTNLWLSGAWPPHARLTGAVPPHTGTRRRRWAAASSGSRGKSWFYRRWWPLQSLQSSPRCPSADRSSSLRSGTTSSRRLCRQEVTGEWATEQWLSVSAQLRPPVTKQLVSQLPRVTREEQRKIKKKHTCISHCMSIQLWRCCLPRQSHGYSPLTDLQEEDKHTQPREKTFTNPIMQLVSYFTSKLAFIHLSKIQHVF